MLKAIPNSFDLKLNISTIFSLLALILFSCSEAPKKSDQENGNEQEIKIEKKASNLFEVEGKVFSIPSPIQTAFLLKETGAEYQSSLLNPTQHAANYSTSFQKAINLGIYGADLGYATIYNQSQDAISYMAVSKRLSNELGISGLFDEALIKRFEQNIGNQDSLLSLVSDAFRKSDQYLKNNERKDASALILAGGWIETLHFATSLYQKSDNADLKNRIGEQKITINNLIKLLLPIQDNESASKLINSLNELKDLYAEVEFTYTYHEPETVAEEKMTIIKSKSEVKINKDQLLAINEKIQSIRTELIQ